MNNREDQTADRSGHFFYVGPSAGRRAYITSVIKEEPGHCTEKTQTAQIIHNVIMGGGWREKNEI